MVTPVLKEPYELVTGKVYRARLLLKGFVECLAGVGEIKSALEDIGFSDVTVWKDHKDVPADWPLDKGPIVTSGLECNRYAQGTWAKPGATLPKPESVVDMWIQGTVVPPPPPAEKVPGVGGVPWAAGVLAAAWAAERTDELDATTRQVLLAIARFEGGYGYPPKDPVWYGSHNWGAIQAPIKRALKPGEVLAPDEGRCAGIVQRIVPKAGELWSGTFVHGDKRWNGAKWIPYECHFRRYSEALFGARDFVRRVVQNPKVREAVASGDALRIASAMLADKYHGTPAPDYARAIKDNAMHVAASLNERVMVVYSRRGVVLGLVVGGLVVVGVGGGGVAWYLWRKRRKRRDG